MRALRSIPLIVILLAVGLASACTSVDSQTRAERDKARLADMQRLRAIQDNL